MQTPDKIVALRVLEGSHLFVTNRQHNLFGRIISQTRSGEGSGYGSDPSISELSSG